MFPTDNEARKVEVQSRDQQERVRHNKRNEELTERGQNMSMGSEAMKTGVGAVAKILGNHPSWYLNDPTLANQTTQISTQIPIGLNQLYIDSVDHKYGDGNAVLIAYSYVPVIALATDLDRHRNDPDEERGRVRALPVNYISKALYAYVKNAVRRNLPYAPADIIRTLYAVIDAYCDIEVLKRVYRLASTYKFLNRTLADTAIRASGFNPNNVYDNLSEILFRINRVGKMLQTVHIPKGQTIFDRQMFLASNIFKDIDSVKSRYFIFKKQLSYKIVFGEHVSSYSVSLRAMSPVSDNPATLVDPEEFWNATDYLTAVEDRVSALLENSEILSALADILTAFESNGFHEFVPLGTDDTQEFIYDPVMVRQVRNATLTGGPIDSSATSGSELRFSPGIFNLYDLGDGILAQGQVNSIGKLAAPKFRIYTPNYSATVKDLNYFLIGHAGSYYPRIGIDTFTDYPDAGELLTVSRLCTGMTTSILSDKNGTITVGEVIAHGTEILTTMNVFYFAGDANNNTVEHRMIAYPTISLSPNDAPSLIRNTYLRCLCYNSVPRLLCHLPTVASSYEDNTHITVTHSQTPWVPCFSLGDMDHVIYIDNDTLLRWHFIAIASELSLSDVVE